MTAKGWQREFEDPILLPSERKLITLREPPTTSNTSPAYRKRKTDLTKSQVAVEALMLVWRSGATMLADRGHEGAEPSCRAGVQSRAQRHPLGETETQERSVTVRSRTIRPLFPLVTGLHMAEDEAAGWSS
jgi:hypothetical protein